MDIATLLHEALAAAKQLRDQYLEQAACCNDQEQDLWRTRAAAAHVLAEIAASMLRRL